CMRLATPCMRLATPCIRLASPRMRLASPCMRLASPCQSPRNFPARVHWAVLQGTQLHSVPPFPYSSLPCSVVFPCCCHAIPNARPSLSPFLFLFSSRPPFISLPCSVDPQMAGGASSKEDTSSQEPPAAAAAISNAQNFSIPLFLLSTLPGSVGPQMAGGASRKEEAEESGKGGGEKGGRGRHGREGNIPGGTWADLGGDACSAHTFHVRELPPLATFLCAGSIMMPASFCCQERMDASRTLLAARWQRSLTMRSKVPVGKSSPRPHVQVNNYGRINSPGDDIRVAMAKNASKAASPTAASGASCDGDEANGDDAEEDWPENGHDDSASGDDVGPADIEEDDWWNRPVGSDDEVEEWHVGDSDNDGGKDAHGNNAEAAADAQEATSKSKRARVVLSDDDGPGEERRPILTAAEKGKAKVAEAPAKAPAKAPARRRTSNKKLTSDGDPGSSKGAAKKKAKKAPNPDDIVVNEPLAATMRIVVQAQDNGWMDETAVQTWLSKEVLPHLNPQRGQNARQAMLVLDSYRGHITQTMLQSYRTHSITPAVIPAGWNLRRPPHPVVLQWIAEAWDQVPKQIIIDAFRHCGISSKLDGTENHLVMSHLRARSTTDVSADMSLGGTTGDNTRLLGRAPEEEEEEAMQAEGVREVAWQPAWRCSTAEAAASEAETSACTAVVGDPSGDPCKGDATNGDEPKGEAADLPLLLFMPIHQSLPSPCANATAAGASGDAD
ncbi:unnamed protein product, partial [Closterium sp. NIES-65]